MANSNSVFGTAQPLQNNVSEWVNDQEQADFAYREEQRKIAALDQSRKDKEQAKKDALRKSVFGDIPKNYDTGSASLNEFQAKIIQKAVNRKGEIYKALSNPNISDDEKIKLEIENQNLDNLPENLQVATKNFSGVIDDYKKGVSTGSYFRNPDFESKVLNGFENYVGGLDNGLPVVGFVDRDGDGVMDVLPYESLAQSYGPENSNVPWNFQKQIDLDKIAVATGEKLGKTEKTTDSNFVKRTIKGPDLNSLDTITNNILQNPDGTPTDAALSELKKRSLANTPENINKVKQIFKERVLAYTDSTDKTDVDYNARTSAYKAAKPSGKEKDKPTIGNPVTPSKETWGDAYDQIDTNKTRSVPIGGKLVLPAIQYVKRGTDATGKATKSNANITDGTVENYTYDKKGKLVLDVSYAKPSLRNKIGDVTETIKEKTKKRVVASPETEARLAEKLGISIEELQERAKNPDAKTETAAERALRIAKGE